MPVCKRLRQLGFLVQLKNDENFTDRVSLFQGVSILFKQYNSIGHAVFGMMFILFLFFTSFWGETVGFSTF
jgi:hypothetical protein